MVGRTVPYMNNLSKPRSKFYVSRESFTTMTYYNITCLIECIMLPYVKNSGIYAEVLTLRLSCMQRSSFII